MGALPVRKRQFHTFLSHAHVDKSRADQIFEWLSGVAEVPVWYDAVRMPPGATIAKMLPDAIENSRSLLLLLSNESVSRRWVEQEYYAAIDHQTQHPAFRIIPVCLDDVTPPGFLKNYSHITLDQESLDLGSAAAILKGLYQPATSIDPVRGRNVYVSRGWLLDDAELAEPVCAALEEAGLQLIGDAEDQTSWVEDRVASIMESCGAFVAVLPYRASSPHRTSKYSLREWELAASRDLPCLVIADKRIELPADIARQPALTLLADEEAGDAGRLPELAAALAEDWRSPEQSPYVFYATDFGAESKPLRHAVKELVESITTLPCVLGEYVEGKVVQRAILDSVTQASLVLADVSRDGPNVYIEIGAARAADVPVFLLREGPPGRPAFMLRDMQVWDYSSDPDLLGRVTRIAYPYRRTLLSRSSL